MMSSDSKSQDKGLSRNSGGTGIRIPDQAIQDKICIQITDVNTKLVNGLDNRMTAIMGNYSTFNEEMPFRR